MNKEKKLKLKEACPEEDKAIQERRERVDKVASILEAAGLHWKTETEKAETILSFSKATLDYDEIKFLASTMSPDYRTNSARSVGVY